MAYKSTKSKFGITAIWLHWVTAFIIFIMFGLGFAATNIGEAPLSSAALKAHIILGLIALALTVFRIIWWVFFDKKPDDLKTIASWQNKASHWVHRLLYASIIIMGASGIGMMVLSGAGEILFGDSNAILPDFKDFAPRAPHGIVARLFIALIVMHVGAALHHHFILRDGLMDRLKLK